MPHGRIEETSGAWLPAVAVRVVVVKANEEFVNRNLFADSLVDRFNLAPRLRSASDVRLVRYDEQQKAGVAQPSEGRGSIRDDRQL